MLAVKSQARTSCCVRSVLSTTAICKLPCRTFSRPTFAPHPLPDIKHIAQNPALYEQNCISRNYPSLASLPQRIAELRDENRALNGANKDKRQELREVEKKIQRKQRTGKDASNVENEDAQTSDIQQDVRRAQELKHDLATFESNVARNEQAIEEHALQLPNLSSVYTPDGSTPQVLDTVHNTPPHRLASLTKSHVQIGAELDILHFDQSATTSGWGWYFLSGAGALLEQALVQYTLSVLINRGWQLVSPPTMIYSHIAHACGFQPRDQSDEQQIYQIESSQRNSTRPDSASHVLAGTAEIPLAGMYADQILRADDLPLKIAAVSRCYRAEAGARGTDTKGLYRVHEFTKVEMFAWTPPALSDENFGTTAHASTPPSEQLFTDMLQIQRHILDHLGLNYRVLEMPSADLGASATRKHDIEVFFPSRRHRDQGWGEVTSASMCTDYQTRRLRTRLQLPGSQKLVFPHTLNGTAMAAPRILAALLECGWDEERRGVRVPEVLGQWMHGIDFVKVRE